jgi:hypothetical protein
MLLVADVAVSRRQAMTAEEQARFGIDKLNSVNGRGSASPFPGRDHKRWKNASSLVQGWGGARLHDRVGLL